MYKYKIECSVSGGVTGSRQSDLKHNGETVIFPDRQTAKAEASRLATQANSGYSSAFFTYNARMIQE